MLYISYIRSFSVCYSLPEFLLFEHLGSEVDTTQDSPLCRSFKNWRETISQTVSQSVARLCPRVGWKWGSSASGIFRTLVAFSLPKIKIPSFSTRRKNPRYPHLCNLSGNRFCDRWDRKWTVLGVVGNCGDGSAGKGSGKRKTENGKRGPSPGLVGKGPNGRNGAIDLLGKRADNCLSAKTDRMDQGSMSLCNNCHSVRTPPTWQFMLILQYFTDNKSKPSIPFHKCRIDWVFWIVSGV